MEKIQFTHQAYVEYLKKIFGKRSASIGEMLKEHCKRQNEAAFKTMEELGFETFTETCWQEAGELILSNEKIEV